MARFKREPVEELVPPEVLQARLTAQIRQSLAPVVPVSWLKAWVNKIKPTKEV